MAKRPVSRECSLESIKEEDETVDNQIVKEDHFTIPRTSMSSLNDDDYISIVDLDDHVLEKIQKPDKDMNPMAIAIPSDPCHRRPDTRASRLNGGFQHDEGKEHHLAFPGFSKQHSKGEEENAEAVAGNCEKKTKWRQIYLVSFINYLIFLPAFTLAVVNFNYLIEIDTTVPVDYNGWMRALMRIGHAIGSACAASYCYTTKTYQPALTVGRLLSIASCLLYGMIELFPADQRRWPWLVIFLVQDAAEGSNIVFRSYVARMSTDSDRQTAYSILSGAEMIAIVSGPGIQALAGFIDGDFYLLECVKINKYTAPIWICLLISILSLIITLVFFREPHADEVVGKMEDDATLKEKFATAWKQLKCMDSFVLSGCLVEKCIGSFGSTTILTLAAPFITATFNTSDYSFFLSIFQLIAGVSSILTVVVFMVSRGSKRLNPVTTFTLSLITFLVMYTAAYPWFDAYSTPVVLRDANSPQGCDGTQYSWCEDSRIVHPWMWVILTGSLIGVAVPFANIGFDTVFSQVLGDIDQNIMQALLIVVVDCTMAFVPVLATSVFKRFGPNAWWLVVMGVMSGGIVLLAFLRPRLRMITAPSAIKTLEATEAKQ
ncbi:hypothetical protein PENTCL1PPCAC_4896 [Pristionchus entomophagus]|uniref:Membrane transporter n=1 Tax=Pristionchus entomophagus TaxID=358040 RepID=A0AAV5SH71_9BILA|nr:hypothetical protein PENTCL1PPCAC_4896 [Pristionchus entomophagus]